MMPDDAWCLMMPRNYSKFSYSASGTLETRSWSPVVQCSNAGDIVWRKSQLDRCSCSSPIPSKYTYSVDCCNYYPSSIMNQASGMSLFNEIITRPLVWTRKQFVLQYASFITRLPSPTNLNPVMRKSLTKVALEFFEKEGASVGRTWYYRWYQKVSNLKRCPLLL